MKLFKHILYVSEATSEQASALERAVTLAENNQADLTVIDVVPVISAGIGMPPGGLISAELQSTMLKKRCEELKAMVEPYRKRRNIQVDVLVGEMFLEVTRAVLRNQYDLVIKSAGNPDFMERLFGSDDMQLLRMCPCPVWLMGPDEKPKYERILVAVEFSLDDSPESIEKNLNQQILELASSLALSDFAELHFVHVWDTPAEMIVRIWADNPDDASMAYVAAERARHENAMSDLRRQLKEMLGKEAYGHLAPQFHLNRGSASTNIPQMAKQLRANLVVMGTVGRSGIAGLFIGNTAEDIFEQLQCSVLAIKPQGFVSPVKQSE